MADLERRYTNNLAKVDLRHSRSCDAIFVALFWNYYGKNFGFKNKINKNKTTLNVDVKFSSYLYRPTITVFK